jgi:hypothetical protein
MNSSLGDVIVDSAEQVIENLVDPISDFISERGSDLLGIVVETPNPDSVFTRPTNGGWPAIYDFYWETMIPLSLLLWGLMIGVIILLESSSYLFSNYHRTKLKKRAFSGLLGILSWWWIAALSLRFIDGLSTFLLPSLSEISLFDTLSITAIGILGLALSLTVDLVLFLILALLYLIRQVVLYLFVLLMPILIVFWVPGVGPFSLASQFMKRLAGFYVPFLFMTVPVALLFRLGQLLGSSVTLSIDGVSQWLLAIVTPLVAIISPFILFWQAGALFFMADRAASQASRTQGKERIASAKQTGETTSHGGRNFRRGLEGKPAVDRDGQTLFGSGGSRAHAAGSRVNTTATTLQNRVQTGSDATTASSASASGTDDSSRNNQFDTLRDRGEATNRTDENTSKRDDSQSSEMDDDRPRYIN